MNNNLDIVESIEAFNRIDDGLKGDHMADLCVVLLAQCNIHGLLHVLMYVKRGAGGVEYL